MYIEWSKHLKDPEQKDRFEKRVLSSRDILERIKEILQEKENALDRSETDIKVFDLPNWAERQAFKNGQRSALAFLKKLVDLDYKAKEGE